MDCRSWSRIAWHWMGSEHSGTISRYAYLCSVPYINVMFVFLTYICSSELWIVGLGLGLLGIGWALSIVAPFQVMLVSAVCHTCNNVMFVFFTYILF